MILALSSTAFWFSVLSGTTTILLATLGANLMFQSGIFNLAIEGTMLICALVGVVISAYTQNLLLSAILTVAAGIAVSMLLGYFALVMKGPMNACGVAINLIAGGGTVFVLVLLTGSKVSSLSLQSLMFPNIEIPLLSSIPFLGELLSGHNLITYLSWLFVLLSWVFLYHTRPGRNLRAVGKDPEVARSLGISVLRMKFMALSLCGAFCAFGGMYMSMGSLTSFTANMINGRGYLSLAMNAMSRGNPLIGFLSSHLYGFTDTMTVYLQLYTALDLRFISALPFILILFVLFILHTVKKRIARGKQLRETMQ